MTGNRFRFGTVSLAVVAFALAACDSVDPLSPGERNASDIQPLQGDTPTLLPTTATAPTKDSTSGVTPAQSPRTTARQSSTAAPTTSGNKVPPKPTPTPSPTTLLPQELVGQWTSVGQGNAETTYRFHNDGTYQRVSVLLQQRSSGQFSFTVTAEGLASVSKNRLTLTPFKGIQTMDDPDAPSSNFNKPLTDLSPTEFEWSFQDGQLILANDLGTVPYDPQTEK